MKTVVVLAFLACLAVSALSLTEDEKINRRPATVSPAIEFSTNEHPPPPTTKSKTLTTTTPTTTTPTTTTHKPTTHKPTTHKPTTHKPTTHKPTTHKPTTHKPTTHKPTTHKPTTHKPTTHKPTTHKPTTHKPTTQKPTTQKPTTQKPTTQKPTTTKPTPPQPTPPTNLTVGNYTVMANKTAVCVMAHMALQIRLATPKSNGTFIVQPKSTHAVGSCEATKANLTLEFPQGFITFMFNKSIEKNTVYVDAVSFSLNYPLDKKVANGPPYTANNKSMNLFAAKIGHSYSCKSEALYMGDGMYLDVNQDQMQAFNLNKNEFGKPDSCAADKPDYRVAIAVGVTLLVLIIIVVVVYLLGRRKRANGYQSL
ncbi:macrosialin isoform X1 [Etheostoma cragini]|uniref:macrosialin isoform X1 n=1 Tax=Etheostoma cragini TaxID=417921 RepID=UPI00155E53B5|nr:macrosialin isoform X1 [Etheostoma cragini]